MAMADDILASITHAKWSDPLLAFIVIFVVFMWFILQNYKEGKERG